MGKALRALIVETALHDLQESQADLARIISHDLWRASVESQLGRGSDFSFTMPMGKLALESFEPWFMSFGRSSIAALISLTIMAYQGKLGLCYGLLAVKLFRTRSLAYFSRRTDFKINKCCESVLCNYARMVFAIRNWIGDFGSSCCQPGDDFRIIYADK